MEEVLIDTGAFYALIDRTDQHHQAAVAVMRAVTKTGTLVFTTNFIRAETYNLALARLGRTAARQWITGMRWPLERVTEADEERALQILQLYDDKDFSFVDAVSFAVMKRLGSKAAFTFDGHFRQFGFEMISGS